ncbi:MAG: hypothetical protein WC812_02235 [Candidatus Pacearchaeota archaeon]|jgi:DNA-directed RNA polymerase specialized sigma24 family protein
MKLFEDELTKLYHYGLNFAFQQNNNYLKREDIEDIVSDSMLALLENYENKKFKHFNIRSTETYFISIVKIKIFQRNLKLSKEAKKLKEWLLTQEKYEPHDFFYSEETKKQKDLGEFLIGLSGGPKSRKILYEYFFEKKPQIKIAQEMGLGKIDVKNRVCIAKKLIKKKIKKSNSLKRELIEILKKQKNYNENFERIFNEL